MSRRGWVLFALMSVIWGMPYLFIKVADGGVSVPVLVFTRLTVAAALLLPLAIRGRSSIVHLKARHEIPLRPFQQPEHYRRPNS